MPNYISSIINGVDPMVGDRMIAARLDREARRGAIDRANQADAISKLVGGKIASGDYAGARTAAYEGGALDVGAKIDAHMQDMNAADRKQFMEGIGIAANLIDRGLKGPELGKALTGLGFDTEDVQGILSTPPQALLAARDYFAKKPGQAAPRYDLDITEVIGPNNERSYYRTTTAGGFEQVKLPPGSHIAPKYQLKDTGTGFVPIDPGTGKPAGPEVPKNPEAAAAATERGKVKGKREAELPQLRTKAEAALSDMERKTQTVDENINSAIEQIQSGQIPATGIFSLASAVRGTPAFDLRTKLETIKANIGFDRLQQMRDNSKTGGALGQVSEFENRLLQAVEGSLDQGQTAEQLIHNLRRIQILRQEVLNDKRRAFRKDFSEIQPQGGEKKRVRYNPDTGEFE